MKVILNKPDISEKTMTVRMVVDDLKTGALSLDNAIQRGQVWTIEKNSLLIYSTVKGNSIPPIYVSKFGEVCEADDGKQRCLAYYKYLDDQYALEGIPVIQVYDDETKETEDVDLNGLKFSQLDEFYQNCIKDRTLHFEIMNEPTEDQQNERFYMLNNGEPLSKYTLSRVKSKCRKTLAEIASHTVFKKALTKKALEKYTNEELVVKEYIMLYEDEPSFAMKDVKNIVETMVITVDQKREMMEVLDRILHIHDRIDDKKIAKRILVRTHMLSIMPLILKSIDEGLSEQQVMEWLLDFFSGSGRSATSNELYNNAARVATGRTDSIKRRVFELEKSFDKWFEMSHENVA